MRGESRERLLLMKPQAVRLLDVFVIGPAMVAGGVRLQRSQPLGGALVVFGILTVIYNGHNYVRERREDLDLV
jgi:hypothetical protein